jgi:type I restriction enzyme S subunit
MIAGWKKVRLGEIVDVLNGYAFKAKDFSDSIVTPIIKIRNVASGQLRMDDLQYYPYPIENFKKYVIEKDDILIALTGSHVTQPSSMVGKVARYSRNEIALLNQRVGKIFSLDKKIKNENYIYWFFKQWNVTVELAQNAGGSANQANISGKLIKSLEINLPPLPEQKSIAAILSSLDAKIENLRQQNKTLEKIAQILFKHWFVDFEFPSCAKASAGKPHKSSGGKMIDSELGHIPQGWRLENLGSICEKISKGTTPTQNETKGLEKDVSFLKVKDLNDYGDINLDSIEKIPRSVHETKQKRSILHVNDILFSIAGTIGRVAIIPNSLDDCNINQALAYIRLRSKNTLLEYTYLWLRSTETLYEISSNIVQAVQSNVSLGVLSSLSLIIPSDQILIKWSNVIKPIFNKIDCNKNQIQTLTKTRDTLLPKLMSGDIRVPQEKQ